MNTRAYWKGPTSDPQGKYPRSCQDILVDAAKGPHCKLPEAGKYLIQVSRNVIKIELPLLLSHVPGSCLSGWTVCLIQNERTQLFKVDMLGKFVSTETGMITLWVLGALLEWESPLTGTTIIEEETSKE